MPYDQETLAESTADVGMSNVIAARLQRCVSVWASIHSCWPPASSAHCAKLQVVARTIGLHEAPPHLDRDVRYTAVRKIYIKYIKHFPHLASSLTADGRKSLLLCVPTHNRLFSESPTFGGTQHYLQSYLKLLYFTR